MKAVKTLAIFAALIYSCACVNAQSAANPSQRALMFADSLLQSFHLNNLERYTDLSYPGIVQYYGGKKNFEEYVRRTRAVQTVDETSPEQVKVIQILNSTNEWQCVIEKTRKTVIDNKKAMITSYLVGQSKDEGQSWTFFDVAFNSVDNIAYIMPDIFETLSIPQRQVVYETNGVVDSKVF